MILETLALTLSGVTASIAFASVLVTLRRMRARNSSVSISIKDGLRSVHIDATGMSDEEIRRLISSLQPDDEESPDADTTAK
ncbi:hypothetical protein AB0F11_18290 [Streptomyces sp. NPDC032472]|uniref:effector-associated constant component EACC1 n=1 Tax=Streptomyces sp. NPDC032472 TaxID=3155018 RepID=UPI0033E51E79